MNRARKGILAAAFAVATVGAAAFGAATPGVVGTDFTSAKALAESRNIPLAVVWGNTKCDYCNDLAEALETSTVTAWVAQSKILVVHKHEAFGSAAADYKAAETWLKGLGKNTGYPLVGLYWKKADGSAVTKTFSGRSGKMPGKVTSGSLEAQFVSALATVFAGYSGSGGGDGTVSPSTDESADASFVVTGTATDRLEADSGTAVVYVPLTRATTAKAAANVLVAKVSGTAAATSYPVAWKAGESRVNVAVAMPSRVTAGRKMALSLQATDGTELATSEIAFVKDVANSPSNPHWVGEYSAKALPYGEWTLDFDAAKAKVASQGGKILAMFAGPLWCPNCAAMDEDVFAASSFRQWAKSEKLVLVLFDQGQASSPSTAAGTERGRLLTFTPSTKGVSGASYLSRHGIDSLSADVAAAIARVTELTAAWRPPESTAARLSNPAVLLLNADGTGVDARFVRQNEGYSLNLNENLARFKDLVTLAGDDETECYLTTTPLALAPGERAAAAFHVNRRTTAWALDGLTAGDYLSVSVTADGRAAQDVYLTLVDADGETVASGRNRLVLETPLTATDVWNGLFLKATSFGADDAAAKATLFGSATSFAATVAVYADAEEPRVMEAFASLTKAELKAANASLCAAKSARIPVYATADGADGADGKALAGVLTVSLSSANRIRATFAGEASLSFSGTWQEINTASGEVYATLTARGGETLTLAMDAAGVVAAALDGIGEGEARTDAATAFAGAYTVTLVPEGDETAGIGTLAVKVTDKGKATVRGTVGAGASFSASGALALNDDGTATLPLYVKKSAFGTLSAALRIKPNAVATWGSAGEMSTVTAEPDCAATLKKSSRASEAYAVYGGFWKSGATPKTACEDFQMPTEMTVSVGGEKVATVTASGSGFDYPRGVFKSLSVARATGALSGRMPVTVGGKTVTAKVAGVLLPGWYDCGCEAEPVFERPFASGLVTYTASGETVAKPFVIELVK